MGLISLLNLKVENESNLSFCPLIEISNPEIFVRHPCGAAFFIILLKLKNGDQKKEKKGTDLFLWGRKKGTDLFIA